MATLRKTASYYTDEILEGIAWVAICKTGRSWNGSAFWLDCNTDTFEGDDLPEVREILAQDPNAVLVNGYYCGHFGEDMTVDELAAGIRWHYENGYTWKSGKSLESVFNECMDIDDIEAPTTPKEGGKP